MELLPTMERSLAAQPSVSNLVSGTTWPFFRVTLTILVMQCKVGARGIRMVAIGTELGVWMGIEGDTNNLRKVLSMDEVTQIGVLEEHHIFLVLAGKN